ncbi:PREDICTED: uncharacterized protein LOC104759751 [Camelina sativa]|uniref:Uncharacterized protein LOC104759751 n=1 Tax=Camelina sativa TaxID=90675 RepID=A0ABM0X5B4_CAMSA|nr:PREDICTED: uncharacterized protein LOC104759751 [Camelina sativa]
MVHNNEKLAPKYYGPYKVVDRCGLVAYKLALPVSSQIHPVFHVSQLKVLVGPNHTSIELPTLLNKVLSKEPEIVLERKMVKIQRRAATMALVKWTNEGEEEATWEYLFDLQRRFPAFEP